MAFDLVVFDLDGTVIDSLADIAGRGRPRTVTHQSR
jgi:beta-phosphoglucomutase-like phosphatase (HAD superfamily)